MNTIKNSKSEDAKVHKLHSRKKRSQTIFLICMLALPFIHWLVFWLYVNSSSIIMAFQDSRTGAFTLENFVLFWESLTSTYGEIKVALLNTLIYFTTSIVVIMPISFLVSYFIYKRIAGYRIFRIIFYLPAIVSAVAMVAAYNNFIDPKGPLGIVVKFFGGSMDPEGLLGNERTATLTILIYTVWTGFGGNIVLLTGALYRVPIDVLEYARLDGVGYVRELFQIIIPMIWPTLSTMLIFNVSGMLGNQGPALLMTDGQYETTSFGLAMYHYVMGNQYNYPAAIGLCMTAVGFPITLLVKWVLDKIFPDVEY